MSVFGRFLSGFFNFSGEDRSAEPKVLFVDTTATEMARIFAPFTPLVSSEHAGQALHLAIENARKEIAFAQSITGSSAEGLKRGIDKLKDDLQTNITEGETHLILKINTLEILAQNLHAFQGLIEGLHALEQPKDQDELTQSFFDSGSVALDELVSLYDERSTGDRTAKTINELRGKLSKLSDNLYSFLNNLGFQPHNPDHAREEPPKIIIEVPPIDGNIR
ncbi:MAG: hypothetical protein AAF549_02640 [Pseudomonadota bacterium]